MDAANARLVQWLTRQMYNECCEKCIENNTAVERSTNTLLQHNPDRIRHKGQELREL